MIDTIIDFAKEWTIVESYRISQRKRNHLEIYI